MDALFPFGFPAPTQVYLSLYVSTLVLHVLFMNYVLAGTAFLAGRGLLARLGIDAEKPAALLREWMPFMLSAAITAGVGPLLFVQIVYQDRFYTANLLLFHRWMAILPILLVGFYLLYLLKVDAAVLRRPAVRLLTKVVNFSCFGFVAWSWTENHLLSVEGLDTWTQHYASGALMFKTPELAPRLALWFCGAFPTLAAWLAWQLRLTRDAGDPAQPAGGESVRLVAAIGLIGIVLASICAAVYYSMLAAADRAAITGPLAGPWLTAAVIGILAQCAGWLVLWKRNALSRGWLQMISAGLLTSVIGTTVVREAIRLARIDMTALYDAHLQAATVSGRGVFVFFLVVNTVLIVLCIRIVRRR